LTQHKRVPQIRRNPKSGGMPHNRGLLYLIKDYFSILFDLKFSRYLTVQLLPLLYVVLVIGGLGVIAQQVWDCLCCFYSTGLNVFISLSACCIGMGISLPGNH